MELRALSDFSVNQPPICKKPRTPKSEAAERGQAATLRGVSAGFSAALGMASGCQRLRMASGVVSSWGLGLGKLLLSGSCLQGVRTEFGVSDSWCILVGVSG